MQSQNTTAESKVSRNVRRQFLTSLFAGAVIAAATFVPASAQHTRADVQERESRRGEVRHPLTAPLSKDDPRALLAPELRDAQPIPDIAEAAVAEGATEPGVVEVNLKTGEQKRNAGGAASEAVQDELRTLPVTGYAGSLDQAASAADRDASRSESAQQETLCVDDAAAIHNTWQYPWSTQVKLFIRFPNGGYYVGSGTMIGSKYVITHQNNVYVPALGGLATSIEVVPGLDGYYKPFGSAFASYLRYYFHGSSNIGLLTLDRHIGNSTGWLGYGNFTDAYVDASTGHIAGYATGKSAGRVLHYDFGATHNVNWDWLTVSSLYQSGQMGAGAYLIDGYGRRYVFGVAANLYYCSTSVDRITGWTQGQLAYVINNGL
jgi:V8-like Glu-specific endopeptidase